MLAILSPAKSLDYTSALPTRKFSEPQFVAESEALISTLRKKTPAQIASLMRISDNLAETNHRRYHEWEPHFDKASSRPAFYAFKGDVYIGLDAPTLDARDLNWAQRHVRILSGLHGLLRPLDRIRPYRLEMGTKLATRKGKDLYDFWGSRVTEALNEAVSEQRQPVLINLASREYTGVLQMHDIDARIINVQFKEYRRGKYQFLSFFAKKARGMMARYMIDKRVDTLKALKAFDYEDYRYNESLSGGDNWVFTRDDTTV